MEYNQLEELKQLTKEIKLYETNREERQQLKDQYNITIGKEIILCAYDRMLYYNNSKQNLLKTDYLIFKDMWSQHMESTIESLKELNITKFILAESSTELQKVLIKLLEAGYMVTGTATYCKQQVYNYEEKRDTFELTTGLLIELK